MLRTLLKLVIAGLVVHAIVKITPVFYDHVRFKDSLQEIANFSARQDIEQIRARVMAAANRFEIPITQDSVTITKNRNITRIDTGYRTTLEYLPGQRYPWEFTIHIVGNPPVADQIP